MSMGTTAYIVHTGKKQMADTVNVDGYKQRVVEESSQNSGVTTAIII